MSSPIKITSSPREMSPHHWSQLAAGQPSPTMSPLQQTPRDFLLNSVNQDERGTRSPPVNYHSVNCLCGPDCQSECCHRKNYGRQPLDPGKTDEKVVFVPKGTSGDNCSVSSYGSTDSTEPLLRGGRVSWSVFTIIGLSHSSTCLSFCINTRSPLGGESVIGRVHGCQSCEWPQKTAYGLDNHVEIQKYKLQYRNSLH